jgi:hypothetical protein
MKIKINKSLIQEGVLQRLTDVHLGVDPNTDPGAGASPTGVPVPQNNNINPDGMDTASRDGNRNLFMGQKASESYAGNHIVNQAKQALKA